MGIETSAFEPGAWWTPERAREAAAAMTAVYDTPGFAELAGGSASEYTENHEPGVLQAPTKPSGAVRAEDVRIRRGRMEDVPRLAELIASADLPPLFIAEFISGFAVAETAEGILACGGLEVYDGAGVIRSIVVEERARGLHLGRVITELLVADARAAGVDDVYLVTADAWNFWKHMGFQDIALEKWAPPAQASWQHRYLTSHMDMVEAIPLHSMWKRL